jgi:fructuronate reductase
LNEIMPRLTQLRLRDLSPTIAQPGYDRSGLQTGIVHLGIGAFHRAHQAVYTDHVLSLGDRKWGICAASLRSAETRDALAPQDGLYSVWARDEAGDDLRIIGSISRILVAPENPAVLLGVLCQPSIKIVSLTVTEKGYCHHPATGLLDEDHPDVRHDLANPDRPRSAPGFIVAALARRRAAALPPFTLLSCDNLPANGETLRRIVTRFAALRDPSLGRYVADTIQFPSTMVDRIVPATTSADRDAVTRRLGLLDAWPAVTENFSQWVIEDAFGLEGRPEWDAAGATFTKDVTPFELAKLRLLNGAHSTLAYLACLAGYATVAEAMAAPGFARLLSDMMDEEVTPELPPMPGFDLAAYKSSLITRFRNPTLNHRTAQIAMDGSQKVPQRLLNTIRDRLRRGAPFPRLALGVAAWMRYAIGWDEQGKLIAVSDPLAAEIRKRTHGIREAAPLVKAFMSLQAVFGEDLPRDSRFRVEVEGRLRDLLANGAAATVEGATVGSA